MDEGSALQCAGILPAVLPSGFREGALFPCKLGAKDAFVAGCSKSSTLTRLAVLPCWASGSSGAQDEPCRSRSPR